MTIREATLGLRDALRGSRRFAGAPERRVAAELLAERRRGLLPPDYVRRAAAARRAILRLGPLAAAGGPLNP
jgi:hypothetical protein